MKLPARFWNFLHPGWILQWAAENAAARHPEFNVCVETQDGVPLCGIVVPEAKGSVTLTTDDGKLNAYFAQIGGPKL